MSEDKVRITRQRCFEQRERFLSVFVRVANPAPFEEIARPTSSRLMPNFEST